MSFTLPSLLYGYDALEPHFDKETMEIHHTKHHQTYVNNTNGALESLPEFANLPVDDLIQNWTSFRRTKTMLRNNAGGHANHSLFWKGLKQGTTLQGELKSAIERDFGSVDAFKEAFEKAAATRFGSGWAWLVKKRRQTGHRVHRQPGQPADGRSDFWDFRLPDPVPGRLGARILSEIPEPPPGLHQVILERGELG